MPVWECPVSSQWAQAMPASKDGGGGAIGPCPDGAAGLAVDM